MILVSEPRKSCNYWISRQSRIGLLVKYIPQTDLRFVDAESLLMLLLIRFPTDILTCSIIMIWFIILLKDTTSSEEFRSHEQMKLFESVRLKIIKYQ